MIQRRPFGRTGHQSTATLFGAAALSRASQDEADRTLEVLLRHGVNHIDTAARYGDSELRIGPWMARHRKDFFLATKTGSRTAKEASEDIHRSLERLRVDHVDLIQLHSLGHPDDWDVAMGPDGALEAAIEARRQGLVRFVGVTGHGWTIAAMHRRSLARFDFDSVLMPYNFFMAANERYRQSFDGRVEATDLALRVADLARGCPCARSSWGAGSAGCPWRVSWRSSGSPPSCWSARRSSRRSAPGSS